MQITMKYVFCIVAGLLLTASLYSQSVNNRNSTLSVHVGPSWYLGTQMGITDRTDSYRDDLRKGIAWDASYFQQVAGQALKFGVGLLYQGSSYKNTHEDGGDKIMMHYLAPQISLSLMHEHYQIQFSGGVGYQFYRDKSTVYGNPRDVSMNKLAGNLALSGEYYLSRHWGVSGKLNWLASSSERYSVEYHAQKWNVENPKTGSGYFGQLSLTFGLNYHF